MENIAGIVGIMENALCSKHNEEERLLGQDQINTLLTIFQGKVLNFLRRLFSIFISYKVRF